MSIAFRCWNPDRGVKTGLGIVEKLSMLPRSACHVVNWALSPRLQHNFLTNIQVRFAESVTGRMPSADIPTTTTEATLRQLSGLDFEDRRPYLRTQKFANNAASLAQDVATAYRSSPPCHAEIVVLFCAMLLYAEGAVGICNHIGISKLCCLVCYAFITEFCEAHHIKFRTSGTHGKMYMWSGLPANFEDAAATGDGAGGGGRAPTMEQALRDFDGTRLRQIFRETRRRVAEEFQDRCRKKYGRDRFQMIVDSDSDTSIDGAASPAARSSMDENEAFALKYLAAAEEPGNRV
jgi:hypothetical protein